MVFHCGARLPAIPVHPETVKTVNWDMSRRNEHSTSLPASLLTRFSTGGFLALPQDQNGPKLTVFATVEDIKTNATAEFWKIPKQDFQRCFQQWQERWNKCVCAEGTYFEDA